MNQLLTYMRELLWNAVAESSSYRLKCCIGSPGWIFHPERLFSILVLSLSPPLCTFLRLFLCSPLLDSTRFLFNLHSSRVLAAFKTRAADLGMPSLFKVSFPGARSMLL